MIAAVAVFFTKICRDVHIICRGLHIYPETDHGDRAIQPVN